jgi:hypothetical protein
VEVAVQAFSVALDDCFDEAVQGRVDAAATATQWGGGLGRDGRDGAEGQLDVPLRHAGWALVEEEVDGFGGDEEVGGRCYAGEAVAEDAVGLGEAELVWGVGWTGA